MAFVVAYYDTIGIVLLYLCTGRGVASASFELFMTNS